MATLFPARYEDLPRICDFITQAAQIAGLDDDAVHAVQSAVDEACSNIIEHAYQGMDASGGIEIDLQDSLEQWTIILRDHGKPFDPAQVTVPDITAGIEDRPVGGLGLYFIRQFMDEVTFHFQPAQDGVPAANTLTLVKRKNTPPARAYAALQRRTEQLTSILEVSHAITSILDFDTLLSQVVSLISRRLNYPYVQVFTVHPGRRKVFYQAGTIPGNEKLQAAEFAYDLDDPNGIIPAVARRGETILANDVSREPLYRHSESLPAFVVAAELTLPLTFASEVLGVLDVQSETPHAFKEDDRLLLEALAGNIAIALRNANLYHTEQWRRQVADGLREVAGLLSAEAELDEVLQRILSELQRNLPCDAAAIWLLDDPSEEEEEEEDNGPLLHLGGALPSGLNLPGEISRSAEPWFDLALKSQQTILRSRQSPPEALGKALEFPDDYSAIAAPLRVGSHVRGLLVLANHAPNRYGSEARSITASFASYAAVAIENTRLFNASHEQAWVGTVLLQVAEATQAITDTTQLLATVAQITPMLVGVRACALWLLDPLEGLFRPMACDGLTPDQKIEFEALEFGPEEHSAFDQVRLMNKAAVIDAWNEENRGYAIFQAPMGVLFPLAVHGEVLGAMLVDFTEGRSDRHGIHSPRDEELAILQGIAHQTATAVENIRLIRSQREEAYISVALLQVAQAIVSLNDLNDILEAIVRITPILVGVQRVAVYLWEEDRQGLRLIQSYGISHEAEAFLQSAALHRTPFPLLRQVIEHDHLTYAPLSETASPLDWLTLTPILAEKPADPSAPTGRGLDRGMMRLKTCLLFGIPLSVKGNVQGVLLVEESQGGNDLPPWYIRERRLEILTGISQQTALAIQNERLQRDVLERERLERELELARQIQQTFLPDALPQIEGWELAVRWRPARQVGGDFYDAFNLPDGKIGLVIADVADKGIPAALFMTLIRTLIRAAVQQVDSPAEVLMGVNDLLSPDMQGGMFVTVVYAVLDPASQRLTYTNAGHNLPVVLRQQGQRLELLQKCGIALGIFENIELEEHTLTIDPGDFVVFYTDGITEAFSPVQEMYGEERLYASICASQAQDAEAMSDRIDQGVVDFTGDEYPSDDLTLVVLQRRM